MEDEVKQLTAEIDRLRSGIRRAAATLVEWAVAFGGHTPSAIVAKDLRQLVGDEHPIQETEPVVDNHDAALAKITP